MSTRCVPTLIIVFYFGLNTFTNAAPYQELQSQPGYIPVYIREGDTSLADINLQLAEAFNEIDSMNFKGKQDSDNGHTSADTASNDGDVFAMVEAKPPAVLVEFEADDDSGSIKVPLIFDSHANHDDDAKVDELFTAPLRPKEETTDTTSLDAMRTEATLEKEEKSEVGAVDAEIHRNNEAETVPSVAD